MCVTALSLISTYQCTPSVSAQQTLHCFGFFADINTLSYTLHTHHNNGRENGHNNGYFSRLQALFHYLWYKGNISKLLAFNKLKAIAKVFQGYRGLKESRVLGEVRFVSPQARKRNILSGNLKEYGVQIHAAICKGPPTQQHPPSSTHKDKPTAAMSDAMTYSWSTSCAQQTKCVELVQHSAKASLPKAMG